MDELVELLNGVLAWSLEYDFHAGNYQTIDQWADDMIKMSPNEVAEIEACRTAGHVWWLQVYPTTPIGFYRIRAPTFAAVVAWAKALRPRLDLELGKS